MSQEYQLPKSVIYIVFALAVYFFIFYRKDEPYVATTPVLSYTQRYVNKQMEDITKKVANDAVESYEIAKRQGDKIQICVQAMLVSAAYLQAKDESNYGNWKTIERLDCRRSGIAIEYQVVP